MEMTEFSAILFLPHQVGVASYLQSKIAVECRLSTAEYLLPPGEHDSVIRASSILLVGAREGIKISLPRPLQDFAWSNASYIVMHGPYVMDKSQQQSSKLYVELLCLLKPSGTLSHRDSNILSMSLKASPRPCKVYLRSFLHCSRVFIHWATLGAF